jgi:CheY-like chemotaxis protein
LYNAAATKTRTVLVAEDDDDVRGSIRMILEADGFATLGAANGAEALALLKESSPDFVLLDMNMPVVTGWDFLRGKARDPRVAQIPVIAITGRTGPRPEGVVALLTKPFDLDEFLALVHPERATQA